MTSTAGHVLQLVGVRAVIQDVRTYLADADRIKKANLDIVQAQDKIATSSFALGNAEKLKAASSRVAVRALEDQKKATNELKKAEEALSAAKAQTPTSIRDIIQGGPGVKQVTQESIQKDIAAANDQVREAKDKLKKSDENLSQAEKALTASTNEAKLAFNQQKVGINELEKAQQRVTLLDKERAASLRNAASIAGAAVVGGISVAAIKSAADFQTELSKINALTNATTEETQKLGKAFLDLSTRIPVSAIEAAEAGYIALSSGIQDVDEALNIATLSSKAQVAQFGDADQISKLLTSTINAYGKENIKASQIIDILTVAVKEGAANAPEFAQQLGRIIPSAEQLGVTFDEVAASVASLTNVGLDVPRAVTGILGILDHLNRVAPQSEEAFEGIGFSIVDIKKQIAQSGLVPFLNQLTEKFKDNQQALGDIFPERRGLNALFAAFGGPNAQRTLDILDKTRHATGAFDEAFKQFTKNVAFQAGILKNQLSRALVEIGTAVLPSVAKELKRLNELIKENGDDVAKIFVVGLKLGLDVIHAFITAADKLGGVLKLLVGHFKEAALAATALAVAIAAARSGALKGGTGQAALPGFEPSKLKSIGKELAGMGTALAWAVPGGPVAVGLVAIIVALDKIPGIVDKIDKKFNLSGFADKLSNLAGLPNSNRGSDSGRFSSEKIHIQLTGGGSIKEAVEALAKELGSVGPKIAEFIVQQFEKAGLDTSLGLKEFDAFIAKTKGDVDDAAEALKKRQQAEQKDTQALEKAQKALEEARKALVALEDVFRSTSTAAGFVKNPIEDFEQFGIITQQLADKLNLSARAAGNIQGIDAAINAREREQSAAFNLTSTLATVAQLMSSVRSGTAGAASALRQLIAALAQAALEAAQAAASALFARPTREVADLQSQRASNRASNLGGQQRNNQQIKELEKKLKEINDQISNSSKKDDEAAKAKKKADDAAAKAARRAAQDAADAAKRAADAILDQLRISNLLARQAFERQDENFDRLLEANVKEQSALQEAFLKNNDNLQKQINEAIGRGDTSGALALVDTQRQATKDYKEQSKALRDTNAELTLQQREFQRQERERARQAELAEALAEASRRQTVIVDDHTEVVEEDTRVTEDHTSGLEKQAKSVQDQIDKLSQQNDSIDEADAKLTEQIDIYQAQSEAMQAWLLAQDQTLLSQKEQGAATIELGGIIKEVSGQIRRSATNLFDLIPGGKEALASFDLFKKALETTASESLQKKFVVEGLDPAAQRLAILNDLEGKLIDAIVGQTQKVTDSAQKAKDLLDLQTQMITQQDQDAAAQENTNSFLRTTTKETADVLRDELKKESNDAAGAVKNFASGVTGALGTLVGKINNIKFNVQNPGSSGKKNAFGGYYTSPTNIDVSESHQPELVLPLDKPTRARQLIASIPPGLQAQLAARGSGGGAVFAPNISVQGATLEAMESMTLSAVRRSFRDARSTALRTGGLLTQGIGPAALRN